MGIRTESIEKILSRNDTGETGGHQAGIHIPKKQEILSFFPALDSRKKNPRREITFHDHLGEEWSFSFIYYNNKFFGGTRNEYRLTSMTKYMNKYNLKSGDILILSREDNEYYVDLMKPGKDDAQKKSSWTVMSKLEGVESLRLVKRYERSRTNRATCIKIHGTGCKICGFNFADFFGELGDGFIHVHHIVPISEVESIGYNFDPEKDLMPVCPNCHSMLHRRKPALLPSELIQILSERNYAV